MNKFMVGFVLTLTLVMLGGALAVEARQAAPPLQAPLRGEVSVAPSLTSRRSSVSVRETKLVDGIFSVTYLDKENRRPVTASMAMADFDDLNDDQLAAQIQFFADITGNHIAVTRTARGAYSVVTSRSTIPLPLDLSD